ncbi:MAG: hypothetical protein HC899_12365 [Leptolyngbyaceae cyanobacterium SM1_4_3]|nr:hypothetical protein [Leptolyngbyaceae cyanobacterium SM1_4_3]NJO66559.1 hypothetical protein [Leptolyngbyaceae cyanobacterium RM1_405_57]
MQTGLPPHRTDSMPLVPIIRFLRICLQIGQIGAICLVLLSLNASLVRAQQAPASPSAELPPSSRITLRMGNQGAQVSELQAMLKLLGYYSGAVDGVYQESTAIAVTAFQQAAGLMADGIVGPSTWERLLPVSPSVGGVSSSTGAIALLQPTQPYPIPSKQPPQRLLFRLLQRSNRLRHPLLRLTQLNQPIQHPTLHLPPVRMFPKQLHLPQQVAPAKQMFSPILSRT